LHRARLSSCFATNSIAECLRTRHRSAFITGIALHLVGILTRVSKNRHWGVIALLGLWIAVPASGQTGNFGQVNIGTTAPAIPMLFTFDTSGTLGGISVLTQGVIGLDFADAGSDTCTANTTYSAGQSCTVNVTFTPKFAGPRYGAVVLQDSTGNTMASGYLLGTGTGPQIAFQPAAQIQLGSGFSNPASVAVDGNGDIFVTNAASTSLYEMIAVNGEVPPSPQIRTIGSGFGNIAFVTIDAGGNLYIGDTANNVVKEVVAVNGSIPASPAIKTLASGLNEPAGVAVDSDGDVFVANVGSNTVEEIVAVNGIVPTSPTILPIGSGFLQPIGVAVDANGNIYVADSGNNAVKEVAAGNGGITTLGSGFKTPYGVSVDWRGNVYVADYGNNEVKLIEAVNGGIPASPTIQLIGSGFRSPTSVVVDSSDNVYVADMGNARVEMLDSADLPSLVFAATAAGAISSDSPRIVTIMNAGNAALSFTIPTPATGDNPYIVMNNPDLPMSFTLNSSGTTACPLLTSSSPEPATLAAGQSCQLPISFAPEAVGTLSGFVVLTDNNLNAPAPNYISQSIRLSGTGTGTFALTSSAASLTMTQGGSSTTTITINGSTGFTGSVSLSASGLPAGVNASFSPNPATGSSVLTLSANSLASLASNQTITITGNSGTFTATTSVLLTVTPANFTLGISATSLQVDIGASSTATITVNDQNGFTGNVNLAFLALPEGVTASFSPNPANGASILTLTAGSTAPVGATNVYLTGTAGTEVAYAPTIQITVVQPTLLMNSPSPVTLSPGSSAQTSISVNYEAGLSGNVTLAAYNLPSGVTASFSPNPISLTGTGEITLSATSSVIPGTYTATITGSSGSVSDGVELVLTIPTQTIPSPGYSLNSSVGSAGVLQGSSLTSTITVVPQNGFAGNVTLAASGLPSGVTASFSPNPTASSSVLTLNISNTAAVGNALITITGTSGALTASTAFDIGITVAPSLSPLSTNFGAVNLGSAGPTQTLVYTFGTAATLGSSSVLTDGTAGLDFTDAGTGTCAANTAYAAGQTCTINVTFTPRFAGARYGAALLKDSIGYTIAKAYLQGTGVGPQLNFPQQAQSTVTDDDLGWVQGVAVDAAGDVYVSGAYNSQVVKETPSAGGYTQSLVPTSTLNDPNGLAVDGAGNLYIADSGNDRVLKETPTASTESGYSESTIGSFAAAPIGVAVDGSGNVYIDLADGTLYEETLLASSYTQTTIPTGLSSSSGVAVDGIGNIYVDVNTDNGYILKETLSGGSYIPSSIPLPAGGVPSAVAVDGFGNVFVTYVDNNDAGQVFEESPIGSGYVQSTVPTNGLNQPDGIAVDETGNIYIADGGNTRALKEDFSDPPSLTFASTLVGSTSTDSPQTVMVENIGNAPLTFPIPSTGNNPSIATNFVFNSSGTSVCSLISSNSNDAGTLPAGGSCQLPISFAPTAAGTLNGSLILTDNNLNAAAPNYAVQSIQLSGTGLPATPTITWPTPAPITYGTALSGTQLDATASVPGTFAYTSAVGTVLAAGSQTLSVTFTPTDATDYTSATATATLTVNKAPVTITWPTPPPITYGTALSSTQLDATASVPGTFAYTPATGTFPAAGTQTLSVIFTPTDAVDYAAAAAAVQLQVTDVAAITSPVPGATLTSSSATFTWTGQSGIVYYQLHLGTTGVGSSDIYNSGIVRATSATITNLPIDGLPIYARLYYSLSGTWQSVDFIYSTTGTVTPAAMVSPTPGAVLPGANTTFTWSAGNGPAYYQLRLGTSGAGSDNLYTSGVVRVTQATVSDLPTDGVPVNARLYSETAGVWQYVDYTYTSYGAVTLAALTSPTPGTTLSGASATFTWSPGNGPVYYQLKLGTSGAGSSDLLSTGIIRATSASVTDLPTDGLTVYARLYSNVNSVWEYVDYTYLTSGSVTPAALASPTPGSILPGSSATFIWTPGSGSEYYQLRIGTSGAGSVNLYTSGTIRATQAAVTTLPTNGKTVYVRLYSETAGVWQYVDYTYIASSTP
jgi:sugar lactone lactonase YvrE